MQLLIQILLHKHYIFSCAAFLSIAKLPKLLLVDQAEMKLGLEIS